MRMTRNMDTGRSFGLMEGSILVTGRRGSSMGEERSAKLMVRIAKGSGSTVEE
jgi:hypothetical protein